MAGEDPEPQASLRAAPERITDHMEAFQRAYVSALAAACGMNVSVPTPDPGIDLTVSHRDRAHYGGVAHLDISLKATTRQPAPKATTLSVQIDQTRFNELREPHWTVPKILVLMVVPTTQDAWVRASPATSVLHHAAYWVNLDGRPVAHAAKPSVAVPLDQILDDVALGQMMIRIGQGGKP